MIAISSFRPLQESQEYTLNQLAAKRTWEKVFTKIFYFNDEEPALLSPKTTFLGESGQPTIWRLFDFAGQQEGWSCVLNADIVLHEKFAMVEDRLKNLADCGFSQRWQGVPPKVIDKGLDIFCGSQRVWKSAADAVPADLFLGKISWDTWTLQYFCRNFECYDFTSAKVVFHPIHGGRKNQNIEPPDDCYLRPPYTWPSGVISL